KSIFRALPALFSCGPIGQFGGLGAFDFRSPRCMTVTSLPDDAAASIARRNLLILVVYTCAIFLSALLLFSVQPLFTKMVLPRLGGSPAVWCAAWVLPRLGGSPAVWSVAMSFFQSLLLAGYAYAHFLTKLSNRVAPVVLHLV